MMPAALAGSRWYHQRLLAEVPMGPLDIHMQRLTARRPDAEVREVSGSGMLVSLPSLALPAGWNKPSTAVHFFAPQGRSEERRVGKECRL